MDLREVGWEGVDWMLAPQDRDQWRTQANTVIYFRVPSQKGLCSMELDVKYFTEGLTFLCRVSYVTKYSY
jgi:hypothetical protein